MTWSDFYLICFIVGLALTILSFLAGAAHFHLPFHIHLPFFDGHGVGGEAGGEAGGADGGGDSGGEISWLNASTVLAFLAWFGGTGYLLTRHSHLVALACFGISTLSGSIAGWVVLRFMVKLTRSSDGPMRSEDYRIEGAVGTLSMPIREDGTGEVIYSLAGTRRCAGARSSDGKALERGVEVVIERYEKGIAYVKKWEEFVK